MRLLLDTHVFLWAAAEPRLLSAPAAAAIRKRANDLFLSAASIWEMAIKRSLGKLETDIPLAALIEQGRDRLHLRILPIAAEHGVGVEVLPFHHKDPFDRLLIAQALAEEMKIVSADAHFDSYAVDRLW